MASFYAELQVAGHTYPVRHCSYEFTQATDNRGRVAAKVHHGLVHLVLNVPDDDFLVDWANTPYKPLPGRVVFYNTKGGAARETLAWEAGNCVGYREDFRSGSLSEGAYVCHVTITAPKLVLMPGGPGRYVPPAPGEHGAPPVALLGVPPALETLTVEELAVTIAPELLPLAPVLLPVAGMVAAVLTLIVVTTTPAQAPGLPHLPLASPDELRLRLLTAKYAAGTLTAAEETELVDLMAKVKGIRVQKLSDLVVEGRYKKQPQALPGFHFEEITYTKRSKADTEALRRKFDSSMRAKFMRKISSDPGYARQLREAGFDDKALKIMQDGNVPKEWQVHHKLPLDDGGDNSFGNLLLIENKPYHGVVTGYQKIHTGKLQPGESTQIKWPTYNQGIVYPPKKP